MYDLYKTIQELCKSQKLTVSKMCLDLGMSKSTMSDLKYGRKKTLSSSTLAKIADYLGVSVDFLLGKKSRGDELKFALFGGDADITDEMLDEVLAFADFVKKRGKR